MNIEKIRPELREYIEQNVSPEYALNDAGHRMGHIEYVIRRSLHFAEMVPEVNYEMVYTVAAYHDIAHHIDHKRHEELSAERLRQDEGLKQFFSPEQIETMAEAVHDHRSSCEGEPRNIYGKIVSSADRNTSVEAALMRSYEYRVVHEPEMGAEAKIEESRKHLLKKFGPGGYAVNKMYFPDAEYEKYLADITELANNPEEFRRRSIMVNHIEAGRLAIETAGEGDDLGCDGDGVAVGVMEVFFEADEDFA